jgi:hypothetical protein
MMKHILIIIIFILVGLNQGNSQTVGLIRHEAGTLDDGYVLFAPNNATTTYLIDRCGKQVKSWNSAYKPGQSAYLLPNGTLFRTANVNNTTFVAGGQGGKVEMIDWNSNVMWSYTFSDATKCQHHDAKVLPNGNVLIIAWELKTNTEAIAQGRNPALVGSTVWSEQILEIAPEGTNGGKVVWEWHLWDHLAQEFDATKPNYAEISSNPQLLNLNYAAKSTVADWIHLNSIDYNPTLDQIMLSSHNTNEIWIIDHSTTTAEAAGHSGGNSGKGGDFLYRWGNPQAYNKGTAADKKFFGQHNAHWIEAGLPFENQIMVFNNGVARPGGNYSTIEIINPPVNGFGYTATLPYLPASNSWIYNAGNPNNFYSMNISGAQQLSNGNVLTCAGDNGTFYEVDNTGKTLWKYVNPVKTTGIINQGAAPTQNMVFRCAHYPADYRGFAGHTLTAGNIIENSNSISDACNLTLSYSENLMPENSVQIYPNPASQFLNIDMDVNLDSEIKIEVSDISGRVIHNHSKLDCSNHYMIDVSNYPKGIYFVNILSNKNSLTRKIVIE